jgi:hypothetical protein
VGYSLRGYYARRAGLDTTISPSFIYNQINPKRGDCQTPTYISDALDFVQLVGAVPMASFPYDPGDCLRLPSRELTASARPLRIETWRRVDTATLDDIKGELAGGHPVVFGMSVAKDFEALTGDEVYRSRSAPAEYGHAMVVAGYDEEKQAFKVANSWGERWGAGGFGWVSYDVFLADVDRAFVMRSPGLPAPVVAKVAPQAPEPNVLTLPSPPVVPAPAVVAPPTVVTPASKPFDPRLVRDRIEQLTAGLACARVTSRVAGTGVVELSGFVASDDQKSNLRRALESLAPGAPLSDAALDVRPWPQCEALGTFAPAFRRSEGLAVKVLSETTPLRDGDRLVLEIQTPPFPAYVYVTYLQAGGDAVHLYQPRGRVPQAVPPSTTLRIGESPGPIFRISEPFGPEMIVVLASASPLFERERPQTQIEREYLTEFRTALVYRPPNAARGPERRVAGAAAWLTTAAQ